ncbi:hypothetical protein [Marilutibacter chinensis]|uniref:DUF2946 family protein n=1 Tax=Marilutibacter chinensis TaxID=2912247 RepID=A0ABS9HTX9_9GAMM|nr:hypothetical protein [Lysobacter chinensis]MCF7221542.1 hypothetical protein [Lysobacter chinensis]
MLRLRHAVRPLSLQRLLVLALLVLGVLAKPVLASIGEVHELQHDPSGQHLHLGQNGDHDIASDGVHVDHRLQSDAPADAPSDDGNLLHELLHFAHCCGQSPQSVPAAAMTVPAIAGDATGPANAAAPAPDHRSQDVFRPPITG